MSTVEPPPISKALTPLQPGERLDQRAFHARYEAMPEGTWAELVDGVVVMPSPLRNDHGRYDDLVSFWVVSYRRFTKGLSSGKNSTVILDYGSEVQPDGHLKIRSELGGQTRIEDGYIVGAPELVIEISRSSRVFDLGPKKAIYERAGVWEYIVAELDPDRLHWFVRSGDRFSELDADPDGIYRSRMFPGLWLDADAFYAEDLDQIAEVLEQGVATPEHSEFAAKLAARRESG
jgi:Uma2 family endonuclease